MMKMKTDGKESEPMPLFVVTIAIEEFEFTVEADDEAQVRQACAKDNFDNWGLDKTWRVDSIHPLKQTCKPEITVTDDQFGEWQGE